MVSAAERIKEDSEIVRAIKKGQREFRDLVVIPKPKTGEVCLLFEGMDFRGIRMIDCTMIGSNFKNANLEGSDFRGSDLADSNFTNADLSRANFTNCNLFNAVLTDAVVEGTNFAGADFSNAQFGDLSKAITTGATFKSDERVRMTDQEILRRIREGQKMFFNINASNSDFSDADLRGVTFKSCNLHYVWFRGANLTDTQFINCDLTDCGFQKSTIKNTNFEKSNLFWSGFAGAFVEKASFRGANMTWMDLSGVDLSTCDLTGADFSWSLMTDSKLSERQMMATDPEVLATAKLDQHSSKTSVEGRMGGVVYGGARGDGAYGSSFTAGAAHYGSNIEEGTNYGGRRKSSDEVAYG